MYVPRDETFEETKQKTFTAGRIKALFHNLMPLIVSTLAKSDIPFTNFADIDDLYNNGVLLKEEEQETGKQNPFMATLMNQLFTVGDKLLKYEIPAIIKGKSTITVHLILEKLHSWLLC